MKNKKLFKAEKEQPQFETQNLVTKGCDTKLEVRDRNPCILARTSYSEMELNTF